MSSLVSYFALGILLYLFFFSSRSRHTICALVTGVQTCALPILSMPFLNTLRGDKPRLVRNYLKSLETVRDLGAEIVVTGHGDAIVGKDRIRADLDKLHAAVSYVRDYTLEGMRSEEHTSELQSLMRISYAVFCLKKTNKSPITYYYPFIHSNNTR